MGFSEAIGRCLTEKYAVFSGRAGRAEFWWFILFNAIVHAALRELGTTADGEYVPNAITVIVYWALFLPSLGVWVRRLHDGGRSGWFVLLWFVPLVGWLFLFLWNIQRGTAGPNRYGEDPLEPAFV